MAVKAELHDGRILEFPDGTDPSVVQATVKRVLGVGAGQAAPAQAPTQAPTQGERTWGEAATDVGAGLVSGTGKLIQFPGQLYGLATGAIGEEDFGTTGVQGVGKDMQDWAKKQKSAELLRREKATEAKVKEAEKTGGQFEAFKTQFYEVIKDPAQLGAFLAEQVPASLPSMIAAVIPGAGPALAAEVKALQVAAQTATSVVAKQAAEKALGEAVKKATASAVKRGTAASIGTGAIQQGTDVGTETFEQNYKYLIKQGVGKEEAAKQVLNTARAAGVSGAAISLLAQKLPGARAMERALAGEKGKLGRTAGAVAGAIKETPGEMLEEGGGKFTQNLAAREFNPEQSLTEGIGQTVGSAALGSTFMGGTVGAIQQEGAAKPTQTTQAPPPPGQNNVQTPEQKAQVLRPLEEIEKAEIEKVTQELLNQNFPEDNARSIAVRRVIENRKRQAKEAVLEPAQNEVEQRVKDLIDAGVDPKLASIQAPEQIAAEKEADALAQSETQGAENAGQPITTPSGTSTEVVSGANQEPTATGVGGDQRSRVVSTQQDATEPDGGKAAEPAPVSFTTAKGSEYKVDADGKTSRTKKSAGKGQGTTYAPHTALYVAPGDHNEILSDMQGGMGNNSVRLGYVEDNTFKPIENASQIPQGTNPIVGVFNKKTGAVVGTYPAQTAPAVGLHPVEKLYTPDGNSNTHVGNAITDIKTENPVDENAAPTEVSEEDQAALQAELADIQNADIDEQNFIKAQVEEVKQKRKRAAGGGRKPDAPEVKAVKTGKRRTGGTKYTTARNRFKKNTTNLLTQLEEANVPLDEGSFENEDAFEQAKEAQRAKKAYVVSQMLDTEEDHRGTALGLEVKKVLNDRTKISKAELDKITKGREVRKKTNTQELIGGVNEYLSPSEGTYTTGPKYSQSRKNVARKVNPKITGVMNGAQALTIIAKTGSPFQKFLANRLRAFVPNLRVVVLEKGQDLPARLTRAGENPEGRWNGLFMPGTDPVVYITGASFGEFNGQNNITLLHEILHAALNNRLYAGMADLSPKAKEFTDKIITLMELARTSYERMEKIGLIPDALRARVESTIIKDKDTGKLVYEIFTSPDEFLSYALTEDSMQGFLRGLKGVESPINKVVSAFSDFVHAVAKVLGIGKGKDGNLENSALLELIDATDKLLAAPISEKLLEAIDETAEGEVYKSTPEKPVPSASVLPDEFKDPVRAAAELKKDTDKAIETVAVSRAGEEGRGIEMMQMARDPEKVLPILQTLVERKWMNMSNGAITQLVKMPTMTFLAKWSGIKSLQDVDSQMQSMLGMSNSLQAAAGGILASFKKELNPLFRSAKEFRTDFENLIYTSTVARVDPSNPKAKEKDARVTALYNKVGPKGQEMFRQLKQYYENLVDLYSDLLDDQVKAIRGMTPAAKENLMKVLRQTFETGARISPYFPLVRRGDYWIRISEKVGKETVQAFYMFETVGERNQYAAQLAAEKLDNVDNMKDNGTLEMGTSISTLRAATQGSSDMLTQVFDAIDQEKFDSPAAKEALKDAIYQVYLNTMPEQKFRSQFIHRKDRAGFSTDVLRNIGTTAASTSKHLAKLKYSPLLRNSLSAANDVAKGNSSLEPFVEEARERVKLALEGGKPGMGDAVAGAANKASFFWFLSGASSALIQPASLYISALPILAANHNNAIAAGRELGKMLTYINQYSVTRENPDGTTSLVAPSIVNNKSLSDLERSAIREMSQRGVTQSTYASEVYGYKSTPTAQASTVLGKTKELGAEAADLLVGSLMHNTERLTREAVYLASYRLGVKRGLSHDAAINQAVDDVNEALGNYDVTNRPRFMQQGIGKVLTQFKMFPLHVTLIMATNFMKMLPILNKEGKKAAATKFFGTYLTAGSIAGLAGVPMFSTIAGVIAEAMKAMQGDDADDELKDLDPTTYFRYVLLPEKLGHIMIGDVSLADLLGGGPLNALTGSAIGERIGLNDMFGRDTKEAKTNREGMLAYVTDKMGPSVSLGLSMADALDAFAVGDDVKAWDKLSPAAIRNIRYAMRLADKGIEDSKGNEIVPPDEISTGKFIAQIIGFRPEEVARMADVNYRLTGAQIKIQNEQTRLMTAAKVAIRKQDDKGFDNFEKVMEDIDKFNERHPTFPIDTGQVMENIAEDMRKRGASQFGVNIDEKNAIFTERVLEYLGDRFEREAKARKK
jgi:hypothetical protein